MRRADSTASEQADACRSPEEPDALHHSQASVGREPHDPRRAWGVSPMTQARLSLVEPAGRSGGRDSTSSQQADACRSPGYDAARRAWGVSPMTPNERLTPRGPVMHADDR